MTVKSWQEGKERKELVAKEKVEDNDNYGRGEKSQCFWFSCEKQKERHYTNIALD